MGLDRAIPEAAVRAFEGAQRRIDRIIAPESRREAYSRMTELASTRPVLFGLLLTQATISLPPLLLFLSFTAATLVFALSCAVAFTVFWTGIALLILLPTLFLTSTIALCLWAWAFACFTTGRWTLGALQSLADAMAGEKDNGPSSVQTGSGSLCSPPPPPPPLPATSTSWVNVQENSGKSQTEMEEQHSKQGEGAADPGPQSEAT